jgi:hypothetical protein
MDFSDFEIGMYILSGFSDEISKRKKQQFRTTRMAKAVGTKASFQGCQIFLGKTYQNGENRPNGHKLLHMAIKYT